MPQTNRKLNNKEKIMFKFRNIIAIPLTITETPIFGMVN